MACVTRMRNSTTDFGLIPFPKYELAQENYYHFVHKTAGKGVCIPTTQSDPEMAGLIIEAMAAKSVGTVTEAYYDKALTYKYMRDEESAEMLDIIQAGAYFDFADAFYGNLSGVSDFLTSYAYYNSNAKGLASFFEKQRNSIQKQLDELHIALVPVEE